MEEAAGRVPVLAGAGGYNTEEVIRAARMMARAGATGILSVTPYYNKPTQEGLFQHYRAIAERDRRCRSSSTTCRAGPAATSRSPTLVRLAALPGIVGVKEASGNMSQIAEVCRAVPPDFIVLSGDDALTLPVMAVGGRGVISVASNEMPAEMARLVEAGRVAATSRPRGRCTDRLLPLMQVNFVEANPIPVKAAMAMMGLLTERYRLPLVPPSDASRAQDCRGARVDRAARCRVVGGVAGRATHERDRWSPARGVERLFAAGSAADPDESRAVFARLRAALSAGDGACGRAGSGTPTTAGASTPG